MKEEWLMPGAVVPVDVETTAALVAEIKRLIRATGKPSEHIPESWATHGGLWIEALCKHQRGEK